MPLLLRVAGSGATLKVVRSNRELDLALLYSESELHRPVARWLTSNALDTWLKQHPWNELPWCALGFCKSKLRLDRSRGYGYKKQSGFDLQVCGGIAEGYSGGFLTTLHEGVEPGVGLLQLGGRKAATSNVLTADNLQWFLDQGNEGLKLSRVDQLSGEMVDQSMVDAPGRRVALGLIATLPALAFVSWLLRTGGSTKKIAPPRILPIVDVRPLKLVYVDYYGGAHSEQAQKYYEELRKYLEERTGKRVVVEPLPDYDVHRVRRGLEVARDPAQIDIAVLPPAVYVRGWESSPTLFKGVVAKLRANPFPSQRSLLIWKTTASLAEAWRAVVEKREKMALVGRLSTSGAIWPWVGFVVKNIDPRNLKFYWGESHQSQHESVVEAVRTGKAVMGAVWSPSLEGRGDCNSIPIGPALPLDAVVVRSELPEADQIKTAFLELHSDQHRNNVLASLFPIIRGWDRLLRDDGVGKADSTRLADEYRDLRRVMSSVIDPEDGGPRSLKNVDDKDWLKEYFDVKTFEEELRRRSG